MGQDFFYRLFFVAGTGKDRQSGGPHHDPLGNQIDAGKHQALSSVNTLGYRVPQKSRIGADRPVSETFLSPLRFLSEYHFPVYYAKNLDKNRNEQNLQIGQKAPFCRAVQKSPQNIAGQNHINHHIIYIFLSLGTYYMNSF